MSMGALFTLPDHRRKGYAKLATLALSRHLAEVGFEPHVYIEDYNDASRKMFAGMGFESWERGTFLVWKPSS